MIACTNCQKEFKDVSEFFAHREECRIKYHQKPRYTVIEEREPMPKRYSPQVRNALFEQIAERQGEWCIHCGFWPARDGPNETNGDLDLHHADNDIHNWSVSNLFILCHKCNLEFNNYPVEAQIKMIQADCDRNVYVTQERKKLSNTDLLRRKIDVTNSGAELKIANLCEVKFRDFALREVDNQGAVNREQIIDAGAEEAGCSIDTIGKYLRKLTSYRGPLEIHKTESGYIITRRKHGSGPDSTSNPGVHR